MFPVKTLWYNNLSSRSSIIMSTKVHRPYLDKMSTRTSTASLSSSSNRKIHILPNLLHTGLTPSCRTAAPNVMLPDGSLNKSFVNLTHQVKCREAHREVIKLESRPLTFKTACNKRINKVNFFVMKYPFVYLYIKTLYIFTNVHLKYICMLGVES